MVMVYPNNNRMFRLELSEQGSLFSLVFTTLATEHLSRLIY